MASLNAITPTTELEAVNAMLSAVGQAPIDDVDTSEAVDVLMAVAILREAVRFVCAEGWRFNTLLGYELLPYDSFDFVDSKGVTTPLNVFVPPEFALSLKPANVTEMQGVDFVQAAPLVFSGGEVPVVLFDRSTNRDGLPASKFPAVYVDIIRALGFTQMPQEARDFATIRAARQYAQQVVGSAELGTFSGQDELMALRKLKREHGEVEDYNMFQQSDTAAFLGGRPLYRPLPFPRNTVAGQQG